MGGVFGYTYTPNVTHVTKYDYFTLKKSLIEENTQLTQNS
jgi:hypothetical protein